MESVLSPYKKGYLPVGNGHRLYYELCGNPKGKPMLYVHGGPGAGFSESSKKWFNPKLWNIILFDQRGSGRSTPFASLEHNTTDDLVGDINKLLDFLKIKSITLFGGSWGSTLSLVYAIRNTKRVNGMLLRGIFLPSKQELDHYFISGVKQFHPEVWERFISLVPQDKRDNPTRYYLEKMLHGNEEEKEQYTFEWAHYEMSLFTLKTHEKEILENMKEYSYRSLSPLEAQYLVHNCFLPDGYILEHAKELSGIPTIIIHGRYDMITRPIAAYQLHKEIQGSQLFFTTAGHGSSDPENKKKLLWAVGKMYQLV